MISIKENKQNLLTFFVTGCICLYLFLYFYNRDIARVGVYLLALLGVFLIYVNNLAGKFKIVFPWFLVVLIGLLFLAFGLSKICCNGSSYVSTPYIHMLVLFPFAFLNYFLRGELRWLLNISLFFVFACILSYVFSSYTLHGIKYFESHYPMYVLMAPIAYVIYRCDINVHQLLNIFIVTGVLMAVAAIADYTSIARHPLWPFDPYPNHLPRVGASINPIHFALIITAVLAVILVGVVTFFNRLTKRSIIVALASICLLGVGVVISGSRTAWISIPFLILVPITLSPITLRAKVIIYIPMVIGCLLVWQVPIVQERIKLVGEEISVYKNSTDLADPVRATTAVGLRLELWKASWEAFTDNPIFGAGPGGFRDHMQEYKFGSSGKYHKEVEIHKNSHSLYLKSLSERGLLGFVSVLLILIYPAQYFLRNIYSVHDSKAQFIAISGLLIVLVFLLGGFFIGSLHKSELSLFYIFFVPLFFGILLSRKENASNY